MPTIESNGDDLLEAVKNMGPQEFDAFLEEALAARSPNKAATLSAKQTKLFKRFNRGLSPDISKRYALLVGRRKKGTLAADEFDELLHLTHEAESCDADRAAVLLELANIRQLPVRALMKQMGIKTPAIHG